MQGTMVRLEPLNADRHSGSLYEAWAACPQGRIFTYMPFGPFDSAAGVRGWVQGVEQEQDPQFFSVLPVDGNGVLGVASYLRIQPAVGTIEVGNICYGPTLQRTKEATEVMHLMMRRVFDDLLYRRYEWKCDALNAASCRAARRLGFTYEGTFRQATHYKGRNRDTAWFAMLDQEWPAIREAQTEWLAEANFDASGRQRKSLSALTASALECLSRGGVVQ